MGWDPPADLSWVAKQQLLAEYFDRRPYDVVVETGCWNGQGSCLQFCNRASVHVIESDPSFCRQARAHPWTVWEGDSAFWLPVLLGQLDRPAFFWLDAHLVAESHERNDSPLIEELQAILAWPQHRASTVLIDDVRMMGRQGWPSLEQVLALAGDRWRIAVLADLLRLTPLLTLVSY